jgi:Flp pilus assembly protein TadG
MSHQKAQLSSEHGAAMVEAAIVLPVFLAIMLISMKVMVLCFHFLRFQYEVSEITRQAFVQSASQRNNLDWQTFIVNNINSRAASIGLATSSPAQNATVSFSNCSGWPCSQSAQVGDIFSISIALSEPVLGAGSSIAGISWQNLTMTAKAVAFVQQEQNE